VSKLLPPPHVPIVFLSIAPLFPMTASGRGRCDDTSTCNSLSRFFLSPPPPPPPPEPSFTWKPVDSATPCSPQSARFCSRSLAFARATLFLSQEQLLSLSHKKLEVFGSAPFSRFHSSDPFSFFFQKTLFRANGSGQGRLNPPPFPSCPSSDANAGSPSLFMG